MTHEHAGGQNTQLQLSPWIGSLTADLAAAAGEIAALFADARAVSAERDEFGHARSRFCADAVALMKASAKVGQTIAQLQGSKFEHNINVRRDPPISKDSSSEDEEEDEDEEGSATLMWLNPDTLWDWRKKRTYVLDPTRDSGGFPRGAARSEGDPLPNPGGSNGNSGNSGAGEVEAATPSGPRVRSL